MLEDLAGLSGRSGDKRDRAPSESWRPQLDVDVNKGGFLVSSPRLAGDEPAHAELLAEFDLDPAQWIVTGLRRSKWQRYDGEWLEAFRVNLRPASARFELFDVEGFEREVRKWRPAKTVKAERGELTAIYASGDTQWGKDAGDGSEGTARRARQAIVEAVARHRELKGRGIGQIALPQLGDCIEGTVSQSGKIVGRIDLPVTAQVRVGRRVLLEWVKAFAPLTESLIIPVVPGNHDEPHRIVLTDPMDSWQVEIVQQVLDACRENPALNHVQGIFAERDNSTLAVNMSGTMVGMIHGHQSRDIPKWWAGQSLGRTPVGDCDVLLSAHYHHFRANQVGPNLWVQIPAMDGGSPWFRDRAGLDSPPGVVSMVVGDGYDARRDLTVLAGI